MFMILLLKPISKSIPKTPAPPAAAPPGPPVASAAADGERSPVSERELSGLAEKLSPEAQSLGEAQQKVGLVNV